MALALPTFSSFGEFFSIYWEALHNCGLMDHESDVESLISVLPAVSAVEEIADQAGLEDITSWTTIEEFDYEIGGKVFACAADSRFSVCRSGCETLPQGSREEVVTEIARLINEESHEAEFALTVKATLVSGKKALSQ